MSVLGIRLRYAPKNISGKQIFVKLKFCMLFRRRHQTTQSFV